MSDGRSRIEPPDISEKGGLKDGRPQRSDERLFVQLLAFGGCHDPRAVVNHLARAPIGTVVYEDLHDPLGIGVLAFATDESAFMDVLRPQLKAGPFASMAQKPEYTMFGRTYSLGYEPDLREALTEWPRRTVLNPDWPWAIWYPLRRSGAFTQLPADVRLACHGLGREDNDFVIGLIGKELFPLSAVIQAMRRTQQTSLYLDRLGPFFIGRRIAAAL